MKVYGISPDGTVESISCGYRSTGTKSLRMANNVIGISCYGDPAFGDFRLSAQLERIASTGTALSSIGPSCFIDCAHLADARLTENVKRIDDSAFRNCTGLSHVNIFDRDPDAVLENIGPHAFENTGLRDIYLRLKGTYVDTSFDEYCFAGCRNLSSVALTQSTYLGPHMFDGCVMLSRVNLNNYHSYVSEYAFRGCSNLPSITLPPKTYMVSDHMFEGCSKLTSVVFQETDSEKSSIRQLGSDAFSGCAQLTSIELPTSVTDFSTIDANFLRGSSVERVKLNGIPSEYFGDLIQRGGESTREVSYDTGVWYTYGNTFSSNSRTVKDGDFQNIIQAAKNANCPIFAVHSREGCSHCTNLFKNVLDTSHFLNWMKDKRMIFVYQKCTKSASHGSVYNFVSKSPFKGQGDTLPFVGAYQENANGSVKALSLSYDRWRANSLGSDTKHQSAWTDFLEREFDLAGGASVKSEETPPSVVIRDWIDTRGADHPVVYISNDGQEFECTNTAGAEYVPPERVDTQTTDDFKYGIWYYNARQLKDFADRNRIPVLAEFSSAACDPCIDFRNSTFNNRDFQDAVKSRKILLCRVESTSNFTMSGSQEYFISHQWGSPQMLIPQLVFYWRRSETAVVHECWNYNYRTDPANANWQTVINKVDFYFGDYAPSDEFLPPAVTEHRPDGGRYLTYQNQPGDDACRYFVVDSRRGQSEITGLDLVFDGGIALQSLRIGQYTGLPDATYCCFTGATGIYDSDGVLFRVESGTVVRLFAFENSVPGSEAASGRASYSAGTWHLFGAQTPYEQFEKLVSGCQADSLKLVIFESSTGSAESDAFRSLVAEGDEFAAWMASSGAVFAEVRADGDDWTSNAPKALRDFKARTAIEGDSDYVPGFIVYHGCSTCVIEGVAEYTKVKVQASGHPASYYIDLVSRSE